MKIGELYRLTQLAKDHRNKLVAAHLLDDVFICVEIQTRSYGKFVALKNPFIWGLFAIEVKPL